MSDLPEIGSGLVTGAMAGAASEPEASGPQSPTPEKRTTGACCLNCGATLTGPFCAACGQAAHVHRSLGGFLHDLLHGVVHFEGKLWRTLPMLLWHPGRMTRAYIDGKRARYVSPIAFFLFVVFVSFALFNISGAGKGLLGDAPQIEVDGAAEAQASLTDAFADARRDLASARANDDAEAIATATERLTELEQGRVVFDAISGEADNPPERQMVANTAGPQNAFVAALKLARANPQLLFYKLQTNAYKFFWLLIPLSVPFVWLLFPFSRRFRMYDHTVFVTYSIATMLALVAVAGILTWLGASVVAVLLLVFYPPLHIYRHVRGTYRTSELGAVCRTILLLHFALAAIIAFAVLLTAMAGS